MFGAILLSGKPPAPAGFDPVSLFGAGDDGWYWEPSLATTFTDEARTTPTTVGGPVGGVTDLSGKANHGLQDTAARRMVLRQAANGSYYYESDSVDDLLQTNLNIADRRITLAMAFRPLARTFLLLCNSNANEPWAGAASSGSISTALVASSVTLNSMYLDNVLFSGTTRAQLYTAAQSANSIIMDITTGAGPGAPTWANPSIGKYTASGFYTIGDTFATLAIDRAITAPERANLATSFMAMVP